MRILLVHSGISRVVKTDLETMRKYHYVDAFRWNSIRSLVGLAREVMKVDLCFSWFLSGHSSAVVAFSKLGHKRSVLVAGGGEVTALPEFAYGGMLNRKTRLLIKYALRNADLVLPVSRFTANETLRIYPPKRMEVIHNGIDTSLFKPQGFKEKIVLTTVGVPGGQNAIRKGLPQFVAVARKIPSVRFVAIGLPARLLADLAREAPSNLTALPTIPFECLLRWYQRAKVYCQLSYHEAFGMAVGEAMSCGCIPIVSSRGALPELVGDCGYRVEPTDIASATRAIQLALEDKAESAQKARRRIESEFSLSKREHALISVLEQLVEVSKG